VIEDTKDHKVKSAPKEQGVMGPKDLKVSRVLQAIEDSRVLKDSRDRKD
jgi:hypothetical protein